MNRKQRFNKSLASMISQERNRKYIKEESDAVVQAVYSSMALAIWEEYSHLDEEERFNMISKIIHACRVKWEDLANFGYTPKKMARVCFEVTGIKIEVE